jgi:hypothetical protein
MGLMEGAMAVHEKEVLLSLLFREGRQPKNVKFFRGDREVLSEAEFCQQVHSALLQRKTGRAKVAERFAEDLPQVEVKELVAAL